MRANVVSQLVLAVVTVAILTAGGRQGHLNETTAGLVYLLAVFFLSPL